MTTAGATAAPNRAPECWNPCPKARRFNGSQGTSERDPAGKAAASPAPNNSRVAAKEIALKDIAVAAVKIDHHTMATASTARGPNRSANQPPGIWQRA